MISTKNQTAHKNLSLFLVALLALSPIPLASNRPILWTLSALLVAIAGLAYALNHQFSGARPLRFPLKLISPQAYMFLIFLLFLIIQIVPLGNSEILNQSKLTSPTLSLTPNSTLLMLMRQLGYGLFFLLMLQIAVNRQRADKILLAIFIITTGQALFAMFALTQWGDISVTGEKTAYLGSATGTFINKNSLATYLGLGAITGLSLFLCKTREKAGEKTARVRKNNSGPLDEKVRRAVYLVAFLIISATIIATHSRMGAFSALIGIVVTSLVLMRGRMATLKLISATVLVAIALIAALFFLFGSGLLDRFALTQSAFEVRTTLYRQVFQMIKARPLTGFGGGSFELAFPLFHQPSLNPDLVWSKAHSSYLTLWAELGIIIGSLPLIIFATLSRRLVRLLKTRPERHATTAAALGATTLVAVHSLLDFSLEIQANTYLFLAILALGIAGLANRPQESEQDSEARHKNA